MGIHASPTSRNCLVSLGECSERIKLHIFRYALECRSGHPSVLRSTSVKDRHSLLGQAGHNLLQPLRASHSGCSGISERLIANVFPMIWRTCLGGSSAEERRRFDAHRQPDIQPGRSLDRGCDLVGDGRVDLYAGFCDRRGPKARRRRSSISAYRRRQAPAAYPQTSGGQPSSVCASRHLAVTTHSWPCSGWGLPSHPGHPGCWWALTPPFHPYRPVPGRRSVFCGTVPRVTPGCR